MNLSPKDIMVFIDPLSPAFYNNGMFEATSPKLNINGQLTPFIFLKERLAEKGILTNTADYLVNGKLSGKINIFVSLGITTNYRKLTGRDDVLLQSFYIWEPPIIYPPPYHEISSISKCFDRVYVYNTEGVGYEKYFNNQPNLRKLYSPQIRDGVIEHLWNSKDRGLLVMIDSSKSKHPYLQLSRRRDAFGLQVSIYKNPGLKNTELYSERIRALLALRDLGDIDLYGYGWDKSLREILRNMPSTPLSFPYLYWKHRRALRTIYKGSVKSKHETLSRYKFNLCFENMVMPGWMGTPIFDCFYVGTVPIFLGAPDVDKYIPRDCFIDMRDFKDYAELHAYLLTLTDADVNSFREAGREYLSTEQFQPFTKESFVKQFEIDLMQTLESNGINL